MSDVALRFGARDDGLNAQFNKTGKDLDALQGKVGQAGVAISASFGKIAAAAAAIGFGKLIGDALEFADQLEAATIRTGISTDGLQKLQFIAKQTSGNLETLTAAVGKMQLNLSKAGEGADEAEKALVRLGIPIREFTGLKPDQQFEKVAVALAKIEDPTKLAATAQGLFGKSYQENLPVLISTGRELNKLSVQFDEIGGPVTKDAIDRVDDLGDSFGTLKIAATNFATELVAVVTPALTEVVGLTTKFIAGLRIAAGGGGNETVNLTNDIIDLKKQLEDVVNFQGEFAEGFTPSQRETLVTQLTKQLDELQKKQDAVLGFGVAGAAAEKARIAAIDAQLTPFKITQQRSPLRSFDFAEGKRETALGKDNPLVVQAQTEADFITKINQEKTDEILRQETDLARARLRVQDDVGASLLDKIDAFSGQVINFARLRSDFEQNATLATVGLVGEALSASFSKNKAVQIAMATISTISGIARALSEYPYPYSLVIGAAVAATGLAQIARIRSTNVGSSGSGIGVSGGAVGSAGSSATTTSPVSPPPQQQRGVAQIIINGPITGEQSMRWLVDRLRESIGDFDLVIQPAQR